MASGPKAFPTVSYVEILEGRAPTGLFAGKIVFVGATALELGDVAATPVNGLTPGLKVQALGTSSLLQGRALHKVVAWPILILAIALFFAVARQCRGRHWLSVIGLGMAWSAGVFALSTALQTAAPVMLDVAPLVLSVVSAVFASLVSRVRDLDLTVVGQSIALRRSSNLMRRVVENTFDGLLTLDRDGTIKSANPGGRAHPGPQERRAGGTLLRQLRRHRCPRRRAPPGSPIWPKSGSRRKPACRVRTAPPSPPRSPSPGCPTSRRPPSSWCCATSPSARRRSPPRRATSTGSRTRSTPSAAASRCSMPTSGW